ncbi:mannose-6-phosphate isomerase [Ostrinia nubilalis]|uniref:mannose-6-phosphate isomerase n=1 Tax=Ostrinia nubilalis TaxID=29057 RepID=UPI0030824AB7
MELQCTVQNYDWGKLGSDSMVAKLLSSADSKVSIDASKPYAELWMGTHPNGPALIIDRNVLLGDYIKDNLDAIGPVVKNKFGVSVPFLLKILSIRKALSIQAHPKKEHAEELHKSFPDMYKDPNHKPELAIALTPFEALCGFRPLSEIKIFLTKLPELTEILSADSVSALLAQEDHGDQNILKQVFHSLMTASKDTIASSLSKFLTRMEKEDASVQLSLLYQLVQRLHSDFPGDVGCWAPYFMNYLELRPGQAIFLKPNLPHAYISGDCVECMACSDNVVRAGLTPKHIDVPTLVAMLDYGSYTKDELLFNPKLEDENCCIWRPPVPDFAVAKIKVNGDDEPYNTIIRPSPSLIIVTSGSGEICDTEPIIARPGVVVFLKASRQLTLTPAPGSHLEAYQAICNV